MFIDITGSGQGVKLNDYAEMFINVSGLQELPGFDLVEGYISGKNRINYANKKASGITLESEEFESIPFSGIALISGTYPNIYSELIQSPLLTDNTTIYLIDTDLPTLTSVDLILDTYTNYPRHYYLTSLPYNRFYFDYETKKSILASNLPIKEITLVAYFNNDSTNL